MTAVFGWALMAIGTIAALAIAEVPVMVIAVTAFALLTASVIWGHVWFRLECRRYGPRWTNADREWLQENGAALPEVQGRRR